MFLDRDNGCTTPLLYGCGSESAFYSASKRRSLCLCEFVLLPHDGSVGYFGGWFVLGV
jgi:hypothetical protein